MRRRALLAAGAALVVGAVAAALPWLSRERAWVTETPVPAPLFAVRWLPLAPGEQACVAPVAFPPHSERVVFRARGGAPLTVSAGRGVTRVAGGYTGRAPVVAALTPPGADAVGRLCIGNAGRRPVSIAATDEPRRARTTVAGRAARVNVVVALQEARSRTILGRAGTILDRLAVFRPRFVSAGLVAALLVLAVLLGVVGAPWAYARALTDDRESSPRG